MRLAICAKLAVFLVGSAAAQIEPLPASMWDDDCTVQRAADVAIMDLINNQAPRQELVLSHLDEMMEQMNSREWDDDLPMVDQMSAAEAARYEELSQKVNNAQLVELIEGKRERDLWAIMGMANIAQEMSRAEFDVSESDEREQVYLAFLVSAEELMEISGPTYAAVEIEGMCNLEHALYSAAADALERSGQVYGWDEAQRDLNAMTQKYGGQLDRSAMSPEDVERLEHDIMPVYNRAKGRLDLANNMLRLGLVEKMSKVRYRAMQQDQYEAPGDLDYMGTNWERVYESSDFTENEIVAAQLLYQLNEMVPADIMETWSMVGEGPGEQ